MGEEKPINYSNCTEEMKLKTKYDIIQFLFGDFAGELGVDYELRESVLSRKEAYYTLDDIKSILALKLSNLLEEKGLGQKIKGEEGNTMIILGKRSKEIFIYVCFWVNTDFGSSVCVL